MTVTVLIVDDQPMVRAGIRLLLDAEEDIEVLGEAGSGTEAIAQAAALGPDVVWMDVRMPGMDGVAATRELVRENGAGDRSTVPDPATGPPPSRSPTAAGSSAPRTRCRPADSRRTPPGPAVTDWRCPGQPARQPVER